MQDIHGVRSKYLKICKKCGRTLVTLPKNGITPQCKCGNNNSFIDTDITGDDYVNKLMHYAAYNKDVSTPFRLNEYLREKYCYPFGEFDYSLSEIDWEISFYFTKKYESNPSYIKYKTHGIDWSEFENIINPPVYTPKCPTCGSPNIQKISATSKATNTILFGLFGTKRNKTFKCSNCGYEW